MLSEVVSFLKSSDYHGFLWFAIDYESFVTTVTTTNAITSFADLWSKLLSHKQWLLLFHSSSSNTSTTFLAFVDSSTSSRARGRRQQKYGHGREDGRFGAGHSDGCAAMSNFLSPRNNSLQVPFFMGSSSSLVGPPMQPQVPLSCYDFVEPSNNSWYPNLGASAHMTPHDSKLTRLSPYTRHAQVLVGQLDGKTLLPTKS
ncbi:hypothetical protein ACH5RR_012893 [Cinchona calisaya]|uniref:Uncharacterized protein n=1 Tax=Cinchona calisaya TaxID=153742 RepID=A0ABD3A956_9GENT